MTERGEDFELAGKAPNSYNHLRACLNCKLVLDEEQFLELSGCPNDTCQHLDEAELAIWSTTQFDGMIAMMAPHKSWVARWQGIQDLIPGTYAKSVPPEEQAKMQKLTGGVDSDDGEMDDFVDDS